MTADLNVWSIKNLDMRSHDTEYGILCCNRQNCCRGSRARIARKESRARIHPDGDPGHVEVGQVHVDT